MSIPTLVGLARPLETFERVLPNRFQHPVARIRKAHEALLDERLQGVELRACDFLGGLQRAAAGEDGEPPEEMPLHFREELVAPLDRRPQRLLAGVGVAAALQQVETLRQPLEDLEWRERLRSRRSELDGQREVVEAGAEL